LNTKAYKANVFSSHSLPEGHSTILSGIWWSMSGDIIIYDWLINRTNLRWSPIVLSLCSNLAFEFVGSWIGFPASTFFSYGKCMIFVEAYGHWPQVFRSPVLSFYFPELRSMSIVLVLEFLQRIRTRIARSSWI
jgi:hypothetical protein